MRLWCYWHREAYLYTHTHINLTHRTNTHTHTYVHIHRTQTISCFQWLSSNIIQCRVMSQWKQQNFQEPRSKGRDGGRTRGRRREGKDQGQGRAGRGATLSRGARLLPEGQCQWAGRGKRLSGKPCFLSRRIFELGMKTFVLPGTFYSYKEALLEVCQQSSWRKSKDQGSVWLFFLNYCVHIMLF